MLVEVAQIDSFIATLGTGTVLYALALWHSGGRQVVGVLPQGFYALNGTCVLGLPITGFYVLVLAFALWIALEYLPIGRYLYAIGANPKAAALNGMPVRRFTVGAFVASGTLTAVAGVLLASQAAHRPGQRRVWSFCCRRWSAPSSARPPSSPGGSTSGARWSAWRSWPIGISGIQQFGGSFLGRADVQRR